MKENATILRYAPEVIQFLMEASHPGYFTITGVTVAPTLQHLAARTRVDIARILARHMVDRGLVRRIGNAYYWN
jgi:hypothetical protein